MFNRYHFATALGLALIVSIVAGAAVALAEPRAQREGIFLGADLGFGGSMLQYELGTTEYEIENDCGGALGLRVGIGASQLETDVDDGVAPLLADIDESGDALAFGLGYEWEVSERVSLGAAFEARGVAFRDFDGIDDLRAGESTLGVTMNYFF